MIEITFRIDEFCSKPVGNLSVDDIDYRCFMGDVWLRVDDKVIDAAWGWVPLVHFATSFILAITALVKGESHAEVPFTETQDIIDLGLDGSFVTIRATFSKVECQATLADVVEAVVRFAGALFAELTQRESALSANAIIRERRLLLDDLISEAARASLSAK